MTAIIGRMGGKSKLRDQIIGMFPENYENMIYVEPFVGGGSILLTKKKSRFEVVNDIDPLIYTIYKGLQDFTDDAIRKGVNGTYTKEEFLKMKNIKPKTQFEAFCRAFILLRVSYLGKGSSYGAKRNSIGFKKSFGERLGNVLICNTSYEKVIEDYDSPQTFIYMDPPYEGSNGSHYQFYKFDHDKFAEDVKKIRGLFCISLNDSPRIRTLFKDYNIETVTTAYCSSRGILKTVTELVITNY